MIIYSPSAGGSMDCLTFISEIVKALAWPAATVFLAILFRPQILDAAKKLRRLRYKDLEASFGEELRAAKSEVERLLSPPTVALKSDLPAFLENQRRFSELVNLSPRGAVLESWLDVERSLRSLAEVIGIDVKGRNSRDIIQQLSLHGFLPHQQALLLDRLLRMQNKAVHDMDTAISNDDAREFRILVDRWLYSLDRRRAGESF